MSNHSKTSSSPSLTAIVLARNESEMIINCLLTLEWCDEVLVIDNNSDDATAELAERAGARVVRADSESFAELRELGLSRAKTDWVLYIDTDERVTPALADEVSEQLQTGSAQALEFSRLNIMYGKEFHHGGWQREVMIRAFKRDSLQGWYGEIHESPRFTGEPHQLEQPLIHLTHRSTSSGLRKTINWTAKEARLLHQAGIARVGFGTIIRKGIMEFFRRGLRWGGYRDGTAGLIESLVQAINKCLIYIQVWELQRRPSLPETYHQLEQDIADQWRQR